MSVFHTSVRPSSSILRASNSNNSSQSVKSAATLDLSAPLAIEIGAFTAESITVTGATVGAMTGIGAGVGAAAGIISGGKSSGSTTCEGAITVSQWQIFSSCRTLPGNGKFSKHANAASERRLVSPPNCCALFCRKCRVSMAMSSLRSRNGGKRRRITFRRWNKSSRNTPSFTRCSRFWWVAAITRTWVLIALCPPTR